jgi:hypothetical protein
MLQDRRYALLIDLIVCVFDIGGSWAGALSLRELVIDHSESLPL